ncbi:hypothetical protein BGZ65_010542, partial [Modicella reniformis]
MSSSGHWDRVKSIASSNNTAIVDTRSTINPGQSYGSEFNPDRPPRYSTGSSILRHSYAGSASNRESSPPQVYVSVVQNAQPLAESPRTLQSPRGHVLQSPGLDGSASAQRARRQANVQDIVARYSRINLASPSFDHSRQDQDIKMISHSGFRNNIDVQLRHEQSQEPKFSARQQQQQQQQEYLLDSQYQRMQYSPDKVMSASVEFTSSGHPRVASRRPMSQQDHHGVSGSRIPAAPLVRRGSVIQRSGRYAHDNVFSEDESIGGLEAWKLDRLPSNSKSGSYAVRLQQIRGRGQAQLQPLHRQLEQFRRDEHTEGHFEENSQQQQQQPEEYSYETEQDGFPEGEHLAFDQHRPLLPEDADEQLLQ